MNWKSQIDQALPIVAKALVEKTGLPFEGEWDILAQAATRYGQLREEAKPATYCRTHESIGSKVWQQCHVARLIEERNKGSADECDLWPISIVGHMG